MEFKTSGPAEKASESRINRKFQTLGAAVALFSTLTFGGLNFSGLGVRDARAQPVEIQGVKADTEKLTNTIANLRKETVKYDLGDGVHPSGTYINGIAVPQEFAITFAMDTDIRFGITYPKRDPSYLPWEGSESLKSTEFAGLVKKLTGKEMKKVVMIMEKTVSNDGKQPVINVYALPADVDGNIIGKYNGGQLALGLSYYPNVRASGNAVGAGISILMEPGASEFHVAQK